ncbi:hypothetical protein CP10881SC42_0744 [Chlamydia avium]|uniref:Uncharacterized protein n=1 Tax=Chlamydia avium TaxID=1457141 RepID=A0ABP2X5V7_9CHLA|nr:hypothetical protein CP10743SC13_0664 [Chlamydia psittaci 10_743_SC13]EPP38022.1 hypothetical protein CP10881SC42_0744 [Chlamydia avium]
MQFFFQIKSIKDVVTKVAKDNFRKFDKEFKNYFNVKL